MANRTTLNISLSKPLREWVDQLVAEHGYATPSEYVAEVVREDRKRRMRGALEARLLAALDSGPAKPTTRKDWANLRERGRAEIMRRRKRIA